MNVYIKNEKTGSVWDSGSDRVNEDKLPEGFKVATQQEIDANEKLMIKFLEIEEEAKKKNAEMIEKQLQLLQEPEPEQNRAEQNRNN